MIKSNDLYYYINFIRRIFIQILKKINQLFIMKIIIIIAILAKFICESIDFILGNQIPAISQIKQQTITTKTVMYQKQIFQYTPQQNAYGFSYAIVNFLQNYHNNISCKIYAAKFISKIKSNIRIFESGQEIIIKAKIIEGYQEILLVTSENKILHYDLKTNTLIKNLPFINEIVHIFKVKELIYIFTVDRQYAYNLTSRDYPKLTSSYYFQDFVKVIEYNQTLLILRKSEFIQDFLDERTKSYQNFNDSNNFIDFAVYDDQSFIIDDKIGIVIQNLITKETKVFKMELIGFLKKIFVKKETVWCIYEYRKRNYLIEMYYIGKKELNINKIYRYGNNIQDLLIFQDIGIILNQQYLTIFLHSTNRLIPHAQYSQILTKYPIYGLRNLIKLNEKEYIVVTSSNYSIREIPQLSLNKLQCQFQNQSTYHIKIATNISRCNKYGSRNYSVKQSYCSLFFDHEINIIKAQTPTQSLKKLILAIFGCIILLMLFIAIIVYFVRLIKKKMKMIQQLREKLPKNVQKKDQNSSMQQMQDRSINKNEQVAEV